MYQVSYRIKHEYPARLSGIEVPVDLFNGDASVRLMAKIDTGASFCIFQKDFAEELGIEVTSGLYQAVATANGRFDTYGHNLDLICLEHRTTAIVYFAMLPDFKRNVLGRAGWLNQHRLGLTDHDSTLHLSHYNDPLV